MSRMDLSRTSLTGTLPSAVSGLDLHHPWSRHYVAHSRVVVPRFANPDRKCRSTVIRSCAHRLVRVPAKPSARNVGRASSREMGAVIGVTLSGRKRGLYCSLAGGYRQHRVTKDSWIPTPASGMVAPRVAIIAVAARNNQRTTHIFVVIADFVLSLRLYGLSTETIGLVFSVLLTRVRVVRLSRLFLAKNEPWDPIKRSSRLGRMTLLLLTLTKIHLRFWILTLMLGEIISQTTSSARLVRRIDDFCKPWIGNANGFDLLKKRITNYRLQSHASSIGNV
jgi:hypothetical protein